MEIIKHSDPRGLDKAFPYTSNLPAEVTPCPNWPGWWRLWTAAGKLPRLNVKMRFAVCTTSGGTGSNGASRIGSRRRRRPEPGTRRVSCIATGHFPPSPNETLRLISEAEPAMKIRAFGGSKLAVCLSEGIGQAVAPRISWNRIRIPSWPRKRFLPSAPLQGLLQGFRSLGLSSSPSKLRTAARSSQSPSLTTRLWIWFGGDREGPACDLLRFLPSWLDVEVLVRAVLKSPR
jgi:hypothetical protein